MVKVTPQQLYLFLQNPNKNALLHSAQLLSKEIPIRLKARHNVLNSLPSRITQGDVQRSIHTFEQMKETFENLSWNFDSFHSESMEKFEKQLLSLNQSLETSWEELLANMRTYIQQNGKELHEDQVLANETLYSLFSSLISLRILLSQHRKAFDLFRGKQAEEQSFAGNIITKFDLSRVIEGTIGEAEALSVQKFGISPTFQFENKMKDSVEMIGAEAHVHFMVIELLKNSIKAMIDIHSIDADTAPPIQLFLTAHKGLAGLEIKDEAGGFSSSSVFSRAFDFFFTTHVPATPTYTYSGSFGVPFEGEGVGLPSVRSYARVLGGEVTLGTLPGVGTRSYVLLPLRGLHPLPK